MEKKAILPAVTIALLSCVALMLAVIGGLYAYNTFVADAQPVAAQSTDKGPEWSASALTVGGDTQVMVVITKVKNPYDESAGEATQMSVYEIRLSGTAKAELYFVASRLLEYDFQLPDHSDTSAKGKNWTPLGIKEALDKAKK